MANTQITAGLTYGSGSKKPKKKKSPVQTAWQLADIDAPDDSGLYAPGEKEALKERRRAIQKAKEIERIEKAKQIEQERIAQYKADTFEGQRSAKRNKMREAVGLGNVTPADWTPTPKETLTPKQEQAKLRKFFDRIKSSSSRPR